MRSSKMRCEQPLTTRGRTWPGGGACAFPVDPRACPRSFPALWSPINAPGVTVIEAADPDLNPVPGGWQLLTCGSALLERHLVLGCGTARLRVCLRRIPDRKAGCVVLAHDGLLSVRLRAASRYARAVARTPAKTAGTAPTGYQRAQLARLLAIADALALGAPARDIAYSIVFPRHTPIYGPAWKGSGERRHTLRLIRTARQLTNGGHLSLLRHG